MATFGIAIAVLGAMAWYGSRRPDDFSQRGAQIALVTLNVLALIALTHEVADFYQRRLAALNPTFNRNVYPHYDTGYYANSRGIRLAEGFTYSALWMAYGAVLMIVGFWRRSAFVRWQALLLIAVTIIKVFVYDALQLDKGYRIVSLIVLGVLLLAISFVYQRDWLQLSRPPKKPQEHT